MPEDLSEFECWAQDIDQALRAAHVMLELIGMQITLLESYVGGRP